MRRLLALALAACAGAFLAAAPASSAPLGAAGQSAGVAEAHQGMVEQVHRRWRRHRNYGYYGPRFYPNYYGPRYYRPYYSGYYGGGYYPNYYRRRPGFSIYLNF